jgi:hypothetical protein
MSKRVSSTVTKRASNPRPRKYANASERQAAYRDRAPEVCFRAEPQTVETLDRIADTIDRSRAELLLSMTKFALTNHDWARFGLTHKPLPFGYGTQDETRKGNPVKMTPHQRKVAEVNRLARELGRTVFQGGSRVSVETTDRPGLPMVFDNYDQALKYLRSLVNTRKTNPMKTTRAKRTPTPAQLAARERFAEAARSGAFKKAGAKKRTTTRKANPTDLSVAQTILAQLGGNRFIAMTGAKSFVGGPTFLGFTIPRNSSPANRVTVTYEPGRDLYSMSFIKTSRGGLDSKEVQRFDGLYADQLRPTFTQVTGMETSLGTMGRRTNPAKPAASRRVNPVAGRRVKFVCIAPMEYSGAKYGIDERTPVTMKFSEREMKLAHKCYQLPEAVVMNDNFQNFAYHNKVIYMSVADLRKMLREYA